MNEKKGGSSSPSKKKKQAINEMDIAMSDFS